MKFTLRPVFVLCIWRALAATPLALAASGPTPSSPVEWTSPAGEHCAYDGVFYSYLNPTGQGFKIWIPPTGQPVRGVILFGNPGGGFGGDTRDKTRQRDLLEFAAWHGFAVGGVNGMPGLETKEKLGRHVVSALAQWGAQGANPELANTPLIFSGSSNAAMFSFGMLALVPERTLAVTPNVGAYYPGPFNDAHRDVPVWIHVGATDPLIVGGVESTENLFKNEGPKNPRWAWDAEMKGHQTLSSDHVDVAFWDAVIPLRLPSEPGGALRSIPYESGWWVDHRSWDHAITKVGPLSAGKPEGGEPGRYGWVPNEGIARIYQSSATRARNLILGFKNIENVAGGESSGVYLSAGGGALASVGETVVLKLDFAPLQRPPRTVDIYDLAEKVGTIEPAKSLEFRYTIPPGRAVHVFHARATVDSASARRSFERVSNPLQLVVRHPELSARISAQLAASSLARSLRVSEPASSPAAPSSAGSSSSLGAKRLSREESAALRNDSVLAPVWTGPSAPAPANLGPDANVTVQAAWDEQGLFLRFRVVDAVQGPVAPPDGRVDFHLARASLAEVEAGPVDPRLYAAPQRYAILRSALQFAFPLQDDLGAPPSISVNRWEPWDPAGVALKPDDGYGGTGLWIDRVQEGAGVRSAEMFIPWKMAGNPGLSRAPGAGASFASVLSYATGAKPSRRLLWPHGLNPWTALPTRPIYGEIRLLD